MTFRIIELVLIAMPWVFSVIFVVKAKRRIVLLEETCEHWQAVCAAHREARQRLVNAYDAQLSFWHDLAHVSSRGWKQTEHVLIFDTNMKNHHDEGRA